MSEEEEERIEEENYNLSPFAQKFLCSYFSLTLIFILLFFLANCLYFYYRDVYKLFVNGEYPLIKDIIISFHFWGFLVLPMGLIFSILLGIALVIKLWYECICKIK